MNLIIGLIFCISNAFAVSEIIEYRPPQGFKVLFDREHQKMWKEDGTGKDIQFNFFSFSTAQTLGTIVPMDKLKEMAKELNEGIGTRVPKFVANSGGDEWKLIKSHITDNSGLGTGQSHSHIEYVWTWSGSWLAGDKTQNVVVEKVIFLPHGRYHLRNAFRSNNSITSDKINEIVAKMEKQISGYSFKKQ